MGREAHVHAEIDAEAAEVHALLESTELILRGDLRRRFQRDRIRAIAVENGLLRFTCGRERVCLHLGQPEATKWAETLAKPPPSLRAKLGLDKGATAFLIGACDDECLAEALAGAKKASSRDADILLARVDTEKDLSKAVQVHTRGKSTALWIVYPKGKGVVFGDTTIRAHLREAGWLDTKSCAVSARLTATRYQKAQR